MFAKFMRADGSFELIDDVKACRFDKRTDIEKQVTVACLTYRDGTQTEQTITEQVFLLSDAGRTVERYSPKK